MEFVCIYARIGGVDVELIWGRQHYENIKDWFFKDNHIQVKGIEKLVCNGDTLTFTKEFL